MTIFGYEKLKTVCAAAVLLGLTVVASHGQEQPSAVVELFTSQGCSSCPAADKILSQYAKTDNVLALAFHVDYWNYLGWEDTFSKAEFTERQRRYAASFKRRGVYTPQAVINGQAHAVGSRRDDIESLLKSQKNEGRGLTVPINAVRNSDNLRITASENSGDATLWIVYFDKQHQVKILRGENRGRTISYHNVVREMTMVGMMKNGKLDVTLPLKEMRRKGHESCAIILQKATSAGTPGAILGATVVNDLDS